MSTEERKLAGLARAREAQKLARQSDLDSLVNTALEKVPEHLREGARRKVDEIPHGYRLLYLRGMTGKSMRAAINANCAECCGWSRAEVGLCVIPTCPFYSLRSWQKRTERKT